jgi:integration host factor subunit beta
MTKAQIIERVSEQVSEQVTGLTKRQAEVVVNTIFNSIRQSLQRGDKTEIRGFGSFRLRSRRMKEGRNPKTGATVAVPAKKVPFFKAGKELKELMNK